MRIWNKKWTLMSIIMLVALLVSMVACSPTANTENAGNTDSESEANVDTETETEAEENEETVSEEAETAEEDLVVMRIGSTGFWDSVNPLVSFSWGLRSYMFDRIAALETTTSVKPGMAESWETNEDKTVWTFKIREGILFHDGTPCTAEDIAWSINYMIENEFPASSAYVGGMTEAIALDETTLEVHLEKGSRGVVSAQLIYAWILPRSVWEGLDYEEATALMTVDAAMGTGPYKLVEYVEGEYVVMDAFEDYWQGKPNIDRVIVQIYANEDAMVQALQTGEIDVISSVPSQAIDLLEADENVSVVQLPALETYYLMVNSYENGTQPESLMDSQVRLAMAYAIDKQQIVNVAFLGYGEPGTIPAPTGFGDLHNPNIEDIPFDLEEGNRILDEAGYLDTDGDGIREYSDGSPLEYRLYTDAGVPGVRALEIVSNGLKEIGISTYPTEVDSIGSLYPDYDFDLAMWSWSWDPDIEESLRAYTCAEVPDGWNDCGFCSEEYDELYALQKDPTISDEERKEIIWEMQEMFFESRAYIVFNYGVSLSAYRNDRFANFITDGRFDTIVEVESILQAEPVE